LKNSRQDTNPQFNGLLSHEWNVFVAKEALFGQLRYSKYHGVFPEQNGKLINLCGQGSIEPSGHLSVAGILVLR
jgi:hypothetical protein